MAKTPKNSPHQLELRVFGDVKCSSVCSSNHEASKVVSKAASSCDHALTNVREASDQDIAIYRGIADRYFRS